MTIASPSMLSVHAAAINSKAASYHEFLLRYAKTTTTVYGFVEGKTDPAFYRGFIEHILPEEWDVELWPAGNKGAVLKIHSDIDWRRFPKKRVCFFVDQDLSLLLGEKVSSEVNIYATDSYSIENDIVRRGTVRRALTEVFGLASVGHEELDRVCDLYEAELERFMSALIPVMAWILFWRRNNISANLNDICMQHLFQINSGAIQVIPNPKGHADHCEYIHSQCQVVQDATADISQFVAVFSKASTYRRFVRGKYLMWFLVEFCLSIHSKASLFFSTVTDAPKMNVSISHSNCVQILGPRARVPSSLRQFINQTYCAYIESKLK